MSAVERPTDGPDSGSAPPSARRCEVGDRMRVQCRIYPRASSRYGGQYGAWGWWTVTVEQVTRLGCGCDRAETTRPRSEGGTCPDLHLYPAGCRHHGTWTGPGIDFDAARAAAHQEAA